LDAIKSGVWNYEPSRVGQDQFAPTGALPGTNEKLSVMAERLRAGLPLWHPEDRLFFDPGTDDR
jgi:hypothetical protein